jgi:hypothetical protein
MAKFGPIKRQHGRVDGLDDLLDDIIKRCPHITRIVPGRMGRKKGNTPAKLKIQYPTMQGDKTTGYKCMFTRSGSWQEVFLVCSDAAAAKKWLEDEGIVE